MQPSNWSWRNVAHSRCGPAIRDQKPTKTRIATELAAQPIRGAQTPPVGARPTCPQSSLVPPAPAAPKDMRYTSLGGGIQLPNLISFCASHTKQRPHIALWRKDAPSRANLKKKFCPRFLLNLGNHLSWRGSCLEQVLANEEASSVRVRKGESASRVAQPPLYNRRSG